MSFWKEAPPPDVVLEMEPEELAPFILRYLKTQRQINRYNFTLNNDAELIDRLGHANADLYWRCVMEAWLYLERQGFVAPQPGNQNDWMFVTRRGEQVVDDSDFDAYKQTYLLSVDGLDPVLLQKVKADFLRGDYESAVFKAFKEIEVRVRKKANLTAADIGVQLMRKAFNPTDGILTDQTSPPGERSARMELFTGAIGVYKNPASHRDVDLTDPREAADIIHTANQLLRVVERIT